MNDIINYLDDLIPNPKSELEYNKDYELLICVMLSSQTLDKRVNEVTKILFNRYPSLNELACANISDIEKIIRPLGTYKKKANNIVLIANKLVMIGYVPNDRIFLESLPGVGRKTTNVVLGILYNEDVIPVDTHVLRVSNRLGLSKSNIPLEVEKDLYKLIPSENRMRIHHQLLLFGRYYCKAKRPLCKNCKLYNVCNEKCKSNY